MTNAFVDMNGLLARDLECKNGPDINSDSQALTDLYLGRAKDLTLSWLRSLGGGDPVNIKPFQTKLLKRFVHTAAQIWSNPPTRRLLVDDVAMPEKDKTVQLVSRIYQRSQVNSYLKSLDRWRTLHGQSILYFSPPDPRRPERVPARIFWPHSVMRDPDDTAQDDITRDKRIAFEIMHDPRNILNSIWHYWEQVEPGRWNAFRVRQSGELVDGDADALYPGGVVPFEGCPFVMAYDELPEGRAWVPIDGTRVSFALGMNVVLNDILFLLKQEAHTVFAVTGIVNQADVPKRWGPGEMWGFEDPEARVHALNTNPKIAESIGVSQHLLEVFAGGEGLPADYFLASRKFETGAAGRLRREDLDARRQDQVEDAVEVELRVFEVIKELWNTSAEQAGEGYDRLVHEEYEMTVELSRQWFPTALTELQQTYAFDLSIGAASLLDYLQERYRLTREQAIDYYDRVQGDRATYVLRENPAALIAGRNNAGGEGSASPMDVQPDGSSMNADRAASVEGASMTAAAQRGISLELSSADA